MFHFGTFISLSKKTIQFRILGTVQQLSTARVTSKTIRTEIPQITRIPIMISRSVTILIFGSDFEAIIKETKYLLLHNLL